MLVLNHCRRALFSCSCAAAVGIELGRECEEMESDIGKVWCVSGFIFAGHSSDWLVDRGLVVENCFADAAGDFAVMTILVIDCAEEPQHHFRSRCVKSPMVPCLQVSLALR